MGVKRFEDLIAWQNARELTARTYLVTNQGAFARDFGLRDQIRRAAVSIMSNVAEGFERKTPNDFRHFLLIAKASCAELRSQLYIALDVRYLERGVFDELLAQANEVASILAGLRTAIDRTATTAGS
jgi:four helix bundle protein